MNILKPTLTKIIVVGIILLGSYLFFLSRMFVDIDCIPGMEAECARQVAVEKQEGALVGTAVFGVPVTLIAYLGIGLFQSRRKAS
ncbi:hypothetical protein A3A38_00875 [Candidatus Kaiserbacteria bacterium RIFCSPLOWO2_01_FULL_53_17]|uniref:Uncharacterized protein n=1 Tax=Candidatus Kaiserbacteria bacterium RIFCSPLOWO2_01_FULL_53_17 TaxID=1798511 RepID=A0A1F6EIH4_9BACT|nr:MAG: hypothetical protein A3A38_00875 [Candidatus Kaiserbacteria bacterium RIFCSPLOWO2_01_FULL_53_17]